MLRVRVRARVRARVRVRVRVRVRARVRVRLVHRHACVRTARLTLAQSSGCLAHLQLHLVLDGPHLRMA